MMAEVKCLQVFMHAAPTAGSGFQLLETPLQLKGRDYCGK
jgi:hypothetical protein